MKSIALYIAIICLIFSIDAIDSASAASISARPYKGPSKNGRDLNDPTDKERYKTLSLSFTAGREA